MQGCSMSLTTPLKSLTAVDSCSQYKTTAELTLFSRYVHKNNINKIIHMVSVIIFFRCRMILVSHLTWAFLHAARLMCLLQLLMHMALQTILPPLKSVYMEVGYS